MNNRVNYTLVGLLVLFGLSLMIGFGYWLLKPSQELEMKKYVILFDESVLGLNIDAPVKYRGISVGNVQGLKINPKNTQQVEVLIDILKSTPIKSSTVAKLTSQGITGLSYINLSLGDMNSPALKALKGEEYPIIKTIPSLYTKLEESFGSVSENLSTTLARTNQLLKDENQAEITQLLKNSTEFMNRMNKLLNDETIKDFQSSVKKFDKFLSNTVEWEDKVSASFTSIMGSYHGIKTTMDLFNASLARGDFNIKEISSEVVPTMNNTLLTMQELMIKIEEAINQYERSPGDMLFTQEKIKKGPGED
ncbi:MlaD family protein [Sulfurimonas sp.]|nr:MlaD family protein [Sulfurimonas sp.]